jgi:hypothetical protein
MFSGRGRLLDKVDLKEEKPEIVGKAEIGRRRIVKNKDLFVNFLK